MTLTRGARITGAVLSAVLVLIVAGWIVRDFTVAGQPLELPRYWAAGYQGLELDALPATSQTDVVLLFVHLFAVIAALRSPSAASVLVATGVVTLVVRLPGLWIIGTSSTEGRYPDELRTRALVGTFVFLAAAIALIITGAAGRRPADGHEPRPAGPGRGAGVTVFVVLGAAAAVLIAWEIRQFFTLPSLVYPDWFIGGDDVLVELTGAPPGWNSVALALLCLVAALTAVLRAAPARPLGMIAAGFLLTWGSMGIGRAVHREVFEDFGALWHEAQLSVLTSFFLALAGAGTSMVLARGGRQDAPGDWNQGYGAGYGYPPGPGGGYGYPAAPVQTPGQGPAPRYGYPQGGGYGPPPPSSPPPGW